MEKLIELLNKYEVEKKPSRLQRSYYLWFVHNFWKWIMYIDEEWEDVDDYRTDYEIISKEYGFIKWLVDNNKITSDWIKPRDKLVKEITILDKDGNAIWWDNKYTEEEQLLMYLSIQDEPIEFLISILK